MILKADYYFFLKLLLVACDFIQAAGSYEGFWPFKVNQQSRYHKPGISTAKQTIWQGKEHEEKSGLFIIIIERPLNP